MLDYLSIREKALILGEGPWMGLMWASVSAFGDRLQCAELTVPEEVSAL